MDNEVKLDNWNKVKKKVDSKSASRIVKIGEICWVNVGQNIGDEVYGKSSDFVRPVLVINKFFNMFVGIPLTSQTKNKRGFAYYHFTDSKGDLQVALLTQIRTFDLKRKVNDKSKVDDKILKEIKKKIKENIIR